MNVSGLFTAQGKWHDLIWVLLFWSSVDSVEHTLGKCPYFNSMLEVDLKKYIT